MSLLIERSGALANLQDTGRIGVRHLGVTQGGGADWIAQNWANWLLGNPLNAAVIEITLGNLELLAETDTCLALCGADLGAQLDGQPLAPWCSFTVRRGQRLRFQTPVDGVRAYIAAPGGFVAPQVLGSCSSVKRDQLGGLHGDGQSLQANDRLQWHTPKAIPTPRQLSAQQTPQRPASIILPVILGAQIADFSGQSLFDAFNSTWQVDQRADRMGIRLLGPALRCERQQMVSEGVPLGAIQVPSDGQPIVLLNDRQTIGGYPRLGALTPSAVAQLAQCLPGTELQLNPMALETAQRLHKQLLTQWV
ncbi:biotin-dependent carboxyltransferase family protein [Pseudomonas sp. M30-35]|uniref:5-oxoprolinase subunit C family protein n=1 Tax=Pseudomonas sp. M30-35 TaxID=1981174 RepID=UPI000B3CBB55|nr:biotin-dependent carboxyltransferase family protein [Pseudomonas sp. M30-35]ARU87718.1 allophanate hydrolase [Pseudomonas sp. M30-35]